MVKTIDVEKADCFSIVDKEMILSDIIAHHKTFDRFNIMLKLHLMLDPLSLSKVSLLIFNLELILSLSHALIDAGY